MLFFTSDELPTSVFSNKIEFGLIYAPCLIVTLFPIYAGPSIYAPGSTIVPFPMNNGLLLIWAPDSNVPFIWDFASGRGW